VVGNWCVCGGGVGGPMALGWGVRVRRNRFRVLEAAFSGGLLSEWLVKVEAVAPISSVAFR